MFNSSQRWQPWGYLSRKNILKLLQKVSDTVWQGVVISSSENNTCLHTKAWKDTSTLIEIARSDFVASIA
jgi:hypothetical protein